MPSRPSLHRSSETWTPVLPTPPPQQPTKEPWACHLASLSLSFPTCKMRPLDPMLLEPLFPILMLYDLRRHR